VLAGAEPLARAKATEVRRSEPPTPCLVECDTVRVERILRNLVVNAVEHGEGRPIDVVVAADDDSAAVTVRDRGVGLRPGESALVFNRFWRSDPSRARTTGGTGLGLSIALEDARLHGGWLEAWGEPGRGSVFRLTLPRRLAVPLTTSPLPLEPPEIAEALAALEQVGEPYRQAAGTDQSSRAGDPSLPPGALQGPR
jgi:two-component system sensor histidine kinase MtrB